MDAHKNFAASLVATAPSPATSGTSLVVTTGEGTNFPTAPFNATIWPAGATPTTANAEIVRVTAVSTDTLTITRAQESTSARTVIVGDQIVAGITAKTLTDVEALDTSGVGIYGDGSDGNVTITTTVTLTRDMWYDTLTVNSPGILKPAGFRIYCKTACVVGAGGSIQSNGNNASGVTAGAVGTNGTLNSGIAGGAAGIGAGTAGAGQNNAFGGSGGAGGTGGSGAGGSGGAVALFASPGQARMLPQSALGAFMGQTNVAAFWGGCGGGGGGGNGGTNNGGAGGAGGGVVILNARSVTNSGTITATGGNGANGGTGNSGGGGSGGGGVVIINCGAFTGTNPTAAAGTIGTASGTGTNGTAGSAGKALVNVWV